jgi:hypothetical protein
LKHFDEGISMGKPFTNAAEKMAPAIEVTSVPVNLNKRTDLAGQVCY